MGVTKSENRFLGIETGHYSRWQHNDGGRTTTIAPRTNEPVVLHRIIIGTTSASAIVVRDASGVILNIKASIGEGSYTFNVKCKGNLIVENPGTSDILIVFSND